MKKLLLSFSILIALSAKAQDTLHKKYTNHHRFEIVLGGGYAFGGSIAGDAYPPLTWDVNEHPIYSIGLAYYITSRINAGIGLNKYTWKVLSIKPGFAGIKDSHDGGLSAYVFANYDLPVRSSIFYGGAAGGYGRSYDIEGKLGNLYEGEGREVNIHIGYKLPLVKKRFWLNIETGYTSTTITHEVGYHVGMVYKTEKKSYSVNSYPVTIGLRFKI